MSSKEHKQNAGKCETIPWGRGWDYWEAFTSRRGMGHKCYPNLSGEGSQATVLLSLYPAALWWHRKANRAPYKEV
jgi:hypothetical protein